MKRGSAALLLIVVGVVLIVGSVLASVVFLPTADPNAGGVVGIVGVVVGLIVLIAGMILRRAIPRR